MITECDTHPSEKNCMDTFKWMANLIESYLIPHSRPCRQNNHACNNFGAKLTWRQRCLSETKFNHRFDVFDY